MQAAGVSNSPPVKQNGLPVDAASARSAVDFGALLAKSIGGTASATPGQDANTKKIAGKHDQKLEPDPPFPGDASVPTLPIMVTASASDSPQPVLLAASPLPTAAAAVVPSAPGEKSSDSQPLSGGLASTAAADTAPSLPPAPGSVSTATAISSPRHEIAAPPAQSAPQQTPLIDPKSVEPENAAPALPAREQAVPLAHHNAAVAAGETDAKTTVPLLVPRRDSPFPAEVPPGVTASANVTRVSAATLRHLNAGPSKAADSIPGQQTSQPTSRLAPGDNTLGAAGNAPAKSIADLPKPLPTVVAAVTADSLPQITATNVPQKTVMAADARTLPLAIAAKPSAAAAHFSSSTATAAPPPSTTPEIPSPGRLLPRAADATLSSPRTPSVADDSISAAGAIPFARQAASPESPAAVPAESDSLVSSQPVPATGPDNATSVAAAVPDPNVATVAPIAVALPVTAAAVEPNPIAPGAPVPAPASSASTPRPDKIKSNLAPAMPDDIRSAASRAAQTHGPLFGENPAALPPLRAPSVVTPVESKNGPEKKSPTAVPPTVPAAHDPQDSLPRNEGGAVAVPRDSTVVGTTAASSSTTHAETREGPKPLPQPDSAPPPETRLPAARVAADLSGDAQMRVGIRTAAFGAVEIYTSVHQNQVGVVVHGERGMAHWFSSEVQNLESGLKDHHLHLTTMELDKGSNGLQTATGSHQQDPQRNYPPMRGWPGHTTAALDEPEIAGSAPIGMASWSSENRVSIRI